MKIKLTIVGRGQHATPAPGMLELRDGARLNDALGQLAATMLDAPLPATMLVVVNGRHVGTLSSHENVPLADRDELLLIAPVAGG